MTGALVDRLARRIRDEGPLSIAAFMAIALHDPEFGYYATRAPIGAAGDFITAPEISQIFGELIGLCCAEWWQRSGRPDPVLLVELGPGRGVLLGDFLRAAASVPEFRRALRPVLVERSPVLRDAQRRHLGTAAAHWVDDVAAVPEGPVVLIANEFLDALPIRQLVRLARGWGERMVTLDPDGALVFGDLPASAAVELLVPAALRDAPPGSVAEICPAAATLAFAIAERLARAPGLALFIDYGHAAPMAGATLRAVRRHRPSGVLETPGEADLSAHVDFAAFAESARRGGAVICGPATQGAFLRTLGAELRLQALQAGADAARRAELASGLQRLLDPAEMGDLFKVLALVSPGLPEPSGFVPRGDVSAGAEDDHTRRAER